MLKEALWVVANILAGRADHRARLLSYQHPGGGGITHHIFSALECDQFDIQR